MHCESQDHVLIPLNNNEVQIALQKKNPEIEFKYRGQRIGSRNRTVKYRFGSARFGASRADEVEDSLGGLGEVAVGGQLGVLLGFLYGPQQGPTVPALE